MNKHNCKILMLASLFILLPTYIAVSLFQVWLIKVLAIVMWTWCCNKVCCCCSCCGQTDDQTERLVCMNASIESETPRSNDYFTVQRIASTDRSKTFEPRNGTELSSCESKMRCGKPNLSPTTGYNKDCELNIERYTTSPAATWTPKIYKVQPELGYEGGTSCTSSARTRHRSYRWHKSLNKLPLNTVKVSAMCKSDGQEPSGGEGDIDFMPITVSAPDLNKGQQLGKSNTKPSLANTINVGGSITVKNDHARWMKSQSMTDINHTTNVGDNTCKPNEVALEHGINTTLYMNNQAGNTNVFHPKDGSNSMKHRVETEILPTTEWDEELPYGVINYAASYYQKTKRLFVHVINVEGLPPKGRCYLYDVILRLSILPTEKQTKHSQIICDSLSPQFNEDFSFTLKDIGDKVLRISVFDAEFQGKYNAIGHTMLYLDHTISTVPRSFCSKLYRQSKVDLCPGFLQISLYYNPSKKSLSIKIHRGQGLTIFPQVVHNNSPSPQREKYNTYAKIALFTGEAKVKSKKTVVVQNSRDPFYDGTFEFNLAQNDHESFLVVSVMLKSLIKESPIGRVVLGPFQVASEGKFTSWGRTICKKEVVTLWYRMCI